MTQRVEYTPEVEDRIARAIWENISQVTEYDAVQFDQIVVRPRHLGLLGILRHTAKRVVAALNDGESGDRK